MRRLLMVVVAISCLLVAVLLVLTHTPAGPQASRPSVSAPAPGTVERAQPPTAETLLLGAHLSDPRTALDRYLSQVGRPPALVEWTQSWSEPLFYPAQLTAVQRVGAQPVVTWNPVIDGRGVSLTDIATGRYDSYLDTSAKASAGAVKPIYVRFAPRMNLPESPFGPNTRGDSPTTFIAAWQHVVTVFRQAGAENVKWVWGPNIDCSGACPFLNYYPGDAYVDWVSLEGYNYAGVHGLPSQSFTTLFSHSYSDITQLTTKPLLIVDTASSDVGASKATWLTQTLLTEIPNSFPRIRGVIWLDEITGARWIIDSSPSVLSAFRHVAESKIYGG